MPNIKQRLSKLEANSKQDEPFEISSDYIRRLQAKMGITSSQSPCTLSPEEYLHQLQQSVHRKNSDVYQTTASAIDG